MRRLTFLPSPGVLQQVPMIFDRERVLRKSIVSGKANAGRQPDERRS